MNLSTSSCLCCDDVTLLVTFVTFVTFVTLITRLVTHLVTGSGDT